MISIALFPNGIEHDVDIKDSYEEGRTKRLRGSKGLKKENKNMGEVERNKEGKTQKKKEES